MRSNLPLIALFLLAPLLFPSGQVFAQSEGEKLFQQSCTACHSIGEGNRVGPDLKGITERRAQEWLLKFIRNSKAMVDSGDAAAREVFEKFNKIVMPDPNLTDSQINAILDFIKGKSGGSALPVKPAGEPAKMGGSNQKPADFAAELAPGEKLFFGGLRFTNGGPACISCHHHAGSGLGVGGGLAKELTGSLATMGEAGISAILKNPPFPAMKAAYNPDGGTGLTEAEINRLVVYLRSCDNATTTPAPPSALMVLLVPAIVVLAVLLFLANTFWVDRKKVPVNDAIYARQVRSVVAPHN